AGPPPLRCGVLRGLRPLRRTVGSSSRPPSPSKNGKGPTRGPFPFLAEREGLLALRARPCGAASAALWRSPRPAAAPSNRGVLIKASLTIEKRERPHEGAFPVFGGEGGIRTPGR